MIREIVKSAGKTYTLSLPDDMMGKTVEVIAFEIDNTGQSNNHSNTPKSLSEVKKGYSKYLPISHENYQFNRDDTHDNE